MFTPLVSIIVPIYKVEQYLRRCLNSIVIQTYTNLEIILVDDGSPDNCPQICDEYAAKDKRIVVIHKENGGLSDARNVGLEKCIGQFIYFCDSDDEISPKCIEQLIEKYEQNTDAEIIIGEIKASQKNNHNYDNSFCQSTDSLDNNLQIRKSFYRTKEKIPVNAVDKLIKRDFLIKNHLFFYKGVIHEDELWMFFIVKYCKKIVFFHGPTYIRHINPNSITTGTPIEKKNLAWGKILDIVFDNLDEPCWKEQFFAYSRLLVHFYSPTINKEIYERVWKKNIDLAYKHKMPTMAILTRLYLVTYPLLKGHGIGFIIWFITKFIYKQDI